MCITTVLSGQRICLHNAGAAAITLS